MRIKHFYYRVVLSLSLTSAGARPLLGVTLLRPARGWYDKTVTSSPSAAGLLQLTTQSKQKQSHPLDASKMQAFPICSNKVRRNLKLQCVCELTDLVGAVHVGVEGKFIPIHSIPFHSNLWRCHVLHFDVILLVALALFRFVAFALLGGPHYTP